MLQKPLSLLILMGAAIGLFIGILDSIFHFINFEGYRLVNVIVFLVFFISVYWSVIVYRDKIHNGIITYGRAFRNTIVIGIVAAFIIAAIRFLFLEFVVNIDINSILDETRVAMTEQAGNYTDEQISNRLSFIEFSYNPFISSILYFNYYLLFVIVFTFFASFLIKRVDRNISLEF